MSCYFKVEHLLWASLEKCHLSRLDGAEGIAIWTSRGASLRWRAHSVEAPDADHM